MGRDAMEGHHGEGRDGDEPIVSQMGKTPHGPLHLWSARQWNVGGDFEQGDWAIGNTAATKILPRVFLCGSGLPALSGASGNPDPFTAPTYTS
jgi:hypothetical protein